MEYCLLGSTDPELSALCLGCLNCGSASDYAKLVATIGAARDAGINFFDAGNAYGGAPAGER